MKVRNVKVVIQSHIWDGKLTFPESPKPIQSSQPQDLGRDVFRESFSRLHHDIHVMCNTRLGTKRWLKLANSQKQFVFMLFLSFWRSQYTQLPVLQHLNFCSKTSDAKKSEFFAKKTQNVINIRSGIYPTNHMWSIVIVSQFFDSGTVKHYFFSKLWRIL